MAGLNFTHKKGDTFEEVPFAYEVDGTALNLTGAVIKMQLRTECGSVVALYLTSVANAGITITNASQGLFKINKQIIDIDGGVYKYDIQITLSGGDVYTDIYGDFTINCDITR